MSSINESPGTATPGRKCASTFQSDGRVTFHYDGQETEQKLAVEIHCPIHAELHEKQAELTERHRAWARKFELIPNEDHFERYCATRFDILIGYQYHGHPLDAAVLASHLMTWFFVFDDNMDMDHALDAPSRRYTLGLVRRHLELLDGGRLTSRDPGLVVAFSDFLRQVRGLAKRRGRSWYQRMTHHLKEYVHGALWEIAVGPTTAARANTAMYMQVRHMAVGVAPCHDLMAIAFEIDPAPVLQDFFMRRLERLAINYSIWVNDLAGLNRDRKRGLANVVFTIQKDHDLSLGEAARMVGRQCDAELQAFFQMEEKLPMVLGETLKRHRRDLVAYCDVLRRWMRGLLDWSARSDRYQRLDIDMSLQTSGTIRDAAGRK